jgi:hypothetical protein
MDKLSIVKNLDHARKNGDSESVAYWESELQKYNQKSQVKA